jgi:hypothetical protein
MSYIELRVEERVTERGERLEASVAAGACSDVYVVCASIVRHLSGRSPTTLTPGELAWSIAGSVLMLRGMPLGGVRSLSLRLWVISPFASP